jgi:hypothetical protein
LYKIDSLSGVVSIFAVISLAIQLGESAIDIKRFLDTIANAPPEVARQKNVVLQLQYIAESIKLFLEKQRELFGKDNNT